MILLIVMEILNNIKFSESIDCETEIIETYKSLIHKAQHFLVIACPYYTTKEKNGFVDILYSLISENEKLEKVLFLYRSNYDSYAKKHIYAFAQRDFQKLKDIRAKLREKNKKAYLFYIDNLHTKCYISEREAIVSSMNFTDTSKNNYENAIHIWNTENATFEDKKCYKELCLSVASIYNEKALNELKQYKGETRYNKKLPAYDIKNNLKILNSIDEVDFLFDESILKKNKYN